MKNILVVGSAPLPDSDSVTSAAGRRTWQFLEPLRKECLLTVVLIAEGDHDGIWQDEHTFVVGRQSPDLFSTVRQIGKMRRYAFAIGVNTFPAFVAAKTLPADMPFWADLNGWIMAEAQVQALELGHDHYVPNAWSQEKTILLRADMVSTVSTPQKFAVLGELAGLGRLNRKHLKTEFVQVIPNAVFQKKYHVREDITENGQSGETFREKHGIPLDAFVVTQIGGFNNWVDEQTLFAGLEKVMREDENIHFLSTGGMIAHIANKPFQRFQERVKTSRFHDRFHLVGWVDAAEMPHVYAASDIGIMVDWLCPETETGARNRLNDMLAFGLPFIVTQGSEITYDIAARGFGKIVKSGDPESIASAIALLKSHPDLCREFHTRSLSMAGEVFRSDRTITPLLDWIKIPQPVLLHRERISLGRIHWRGVLAFWRERGLRAVWSKIWQKLKAR